MADFSLYFNEKDDKDLLEFIHETRIQLSTPNYMESKGGTIKRMLRNYQEIKKKENGKEEKKYEENI